MSVSVPSVLSHLSHELRGPLGVLRGYLRLLDQGTPALEDRQRRAVMAAMAASERAITLVGEASELGRLLRGEITWRKATVPFASVLHATVQAVDLPEEPAIDLDVPDTSNAVVQVDEGRMRAALAALITSVVRAQARPGTVLLTATATRAANQPVVRLVIAPHTVSRLRARERELHPAKGGQGLLVAIAITVIEAHGGVVKERHLGNRAAGITVRLPAVK